jgi:hypothetical protein
MADGSVMKDSEMEGMESGHGEREHGSEAEDASAPGAVDERTQGPSGPAAMICSMEIAEAVQRTFALPSVPEASDEWADRTYTCTYRLPDGELRLSVKDLDEKRPGLAYFSAVERRLPGAERIRGLQNLGFPALQTGPAAGRVAFLKDDKTLVVDASGVAAGDLPPGFSRTGAAYGVAASVIACWTE